MAELNTEAIIANQPYPLLFATISGAHLYGFPSPDSDYDLRGVHILPLREVAGLYETTETIETSSEVSGIELDLVTHDAAKFFALMLKRNGYVLEQLFSPLIVHTTPEHDILKAMRRAASQSITPTIISALRGRSGDCSFRRIRAGLSRCCTFIACCFPAFI